STPPPHPHPFPTRRSSDLDDPSMLTSDYIAEQTIARRLQGRVTVGHLSTLDVLEPDHRARVIDKLREAGLHVISLPATELHVKRSEEHTSELQSRGHLVCR